MKKVPIIKALEKNIHVLSECTSNISMGEGVALVRAVEKSNAYYMIAENYPFMKFNQEMRKVYQSGVLGKALFASLAYYNKQNGAKFMTFYTGLINHARYIYMGAGFKIAMSYCSMTKKIK